MLEPNLAAHGRGNRDRLVRGRKDGFRVEQLEEVAQVEIVLVHPRESPEDPLDRVLHRLGRGGVEGQVSQRQPSGDRLQGDVEIGDRGRDRAQVAPQKADRVAAHHLPSLAPVVGPADQPVAIDEIPAESKELDLLRVAVGGQQGDQVVHTAKQTGSPAGDVVAAPAVPGVGDEGRDGGDEGDQCQQRTDHDEQGDHADEGQRGLHQPEGGGDHHHRSVDRIRLGPAQQVIRCRVLVEGEVQTGRLFHHHQLDSHRDRVLQQLLGDVARRAQERDQGKDQQLQDGQKDDGVQRGVNRVPRAKVEPDLVGDRFPADDPLVNHNAPDNGVHQQLRCVGGDGRDDPRHDGRGKQPSRDPGAGIPHEPEDLRQRRRGPTDRLFQRAPASAPVLRTLIRRLLDHRIPGQAAVRRPGVRTAGAATTPHPEHGGATVTRWHHSHGATLP